MANGKFAALAEMNTNRSSMGIVQRGKLGGKRGNPNFQQYSVLLKRESWREAQALMHSPGQDAAFQTTTGRLDFSELMQSLLDRWLAEQMKK